MSSRLRNILRTGSGQLAETSLEELSNQAGRDIAPKQPLESSVIGGNPHQAKMAGSKAQKDSALRQSLSEPQRLSTALRRQDVRRDTTTDEQGRLERGQRLEQLGSLEGRVEELANQALDQSNADADVELGINSESPEEVALLERIRANPQDTSTIAEFNRLKGRTQANNILSAEEILQQFDKTTGIGDALAGSVQDSIQAGALNFEDMGFSSPNEVAELLGVNPEQLGQFSVQELIDSVNSQIEQEFTEVNDLQNQANDPFLGAAERAEARKRLREAGAVGVRSAESDIDKMADEIADANTVEFMGEELQIEELLDNDYISGLAANYFDDPNFAEQLREEEPGLVTFITKHENLLKDAATEVGEGVKEFAKLQQENLNVGKVAGGQRLSEDVMKSIFPDYGEITDQKYNKNSSPLLTYLSDPRTTSGAQIETVQNINNITKTRPELASDIATLNKQQLESLGFTGRNPQALEDVQAYYDTYDTYQRTGGNLSENDILSSINPDQSPEQTRSQLEEAMKKVSSGLFSGELPISRDSITNSTDYSKLLINLRNNYSNKKGLADLAGGGIPDSFATLNNNLSSINGQKNKAYELLKDNLEDGPVLTSEDVKDLRQRLNFDDLETVLSETKDSKTLTKESKERTALQRMAVAKFIKEPNGLDEVVNRSTDGFSSFKEALDSARVDIGTMEESGVEGRGTMLSHLTNSLDSLKQNAQMYPEGSLRKRLADSAVRQLEKSRTEYNNKKMSLDKEAELANKKPLITEEQRNAMRGQWILR
jgi:uncharacterized protein YerC